MTPSDNNKMSISPLYPLQFEYEESVENAFEQALNYVSEQSLMESADLVNYTDNISGKLPIILLDLETSGFGRNCEILQIAAKCGTKCFETYINPTKQIHFRASRVNGLTNFDGVLQYNGKPVASVPLINAMRNLYTWLTSFDKKCYIATHNLSFDGPRLHDAITTSNLRNEFSQVIYGFIDTLSVIRKHTERKAKGQCTLTGLAEWLDIPSDHVHSAPRDVEILDAILQRAEITPEKLINCAKPYSEQTDKWENDKYVKGILPSLDRLKGVVGETIRKKMAVASITIEDLQEAYAESGQRGISELLGDKVDGKPIVTNRTDTILKIVNWIETSTNDSSDDLMNSLHRCFDFLE